MKRELFKRTGPKKLEEGSFQGRGMLKKKIEKKLKGRVSSRRNK